MDVNRMKPLVDDFVQAVDDAIAYNSVERVEEADRAQTQLRRLLYPMTRIIDVLNEPPISASLTPFDQEDPLWSWLRTAQEIQGVLEHVDDVNDMLRPVAPTLAADRLHPWVWEPASAFWETGHYPSAVETAAKSLTAHIQQMAESTLADRELVADVFAPRRKDGRTRLWLPGERDTDTWRSRQDGLHQVAMGAFAGIRNVATHSLETGWSEQESLEYLAVLSTVARWAAETEVVSGE